MIVVSMRAQRAGTTDPLLRGAYSLILNVLVSSGLGIGFWIAAARLFSAAAVGRDAALVAAMTAVSTVCALNLSSAVLRFLPVTRMSPARVVAGAYAMTAVVSALGASAFVLLAPRVSSAYAFLSRDHALAVLWGLAVLAWGVFALQDAVLTALRRAPWVPVENGLFGVLKLAALPVLLWLGSAHAVFIGWMIPMILLLVPVNWAIFRRFIPARSLSADARSPVQQLGWRGLRRFMAADYAAMIFLQAGTTLLPALVLALVGGRRGAYFYMPFALVGAFDAVFSQALTALTVEAAMTPERLPALVRLTVRRLGWLLALGVLVLVAGAPLVLLPFGAQYVHGGSAVLMLLALASPGRAIIALFGAICRVRARMAALLALQAALFALIAGLTVLLARREGLAGVGLAWLIAHGLGAAAVSPALRAYVRPGRLRARRLREQPS